MKIGDKVLIRATSQYYGQHDDVGTIIADRPEDFYGLPIKVQWPDGYENTYREFDLRLAEIKIALWDE